MPCYTVRLISVEFKAQNISLLEETAKALHLNFQRQGNRVQIGNVTIDLDSQTAQARNQEDINILKRAYSEQAVKQASKAKGWTLNAWQTKNKVKSTIATKY